MAARAVTGSRSAIARRDSSSNSSASTISSALGNNCTTSLRSTTVSWRPAARRA
jgi:hypothetical protein